MQTNPGLQKLVSGIVGLPFGLIMVIICGAELFTGNTCMCAAAFYEGRISFAQLLRIWVVSFTSESDFLSVRYPSRQSTDLLRLPHVLRSWIVSNATWCLMHLAICACLNMLCRLGTFSIAVNLAGSIALVALVVAARIAPPVATTVGLAAKKSTLPFMQVGAQWLNY